MDRYEFHTKEYATIKSRDSKLNGKTIGLKTRLIQHLDNGAKKIYEFDFQKQARDFLKNKYGADGAIKGRYTILSNMEIYGKRGYKWE